MTIKHHYHVKWTEQITKTIISYYSVLDWLFLTVELYRIMSQRILFFTRFTCIRSYSNLLVFIPVYLRKNQCFCFSDYCRNKTYKHNNMNPIFLLSCSLEYKIENYCTVIQKVIWRHVFRKCLSRVCIGWKKKSKHLISYTINYNFTNALVI